MTEALWTEIEKLDVLRERLGIGYEEAREALNLAQGDVVKALDYYEKAQAENKGFDFADQGREIWDNVKSSVADFSHSTISLKKHEETIISLSAPLGLALAYTIWRKPGLRLLALVGAIGAVMNNFELEVVTKEKVLDEDDAADFGMDKEY